MATNDELKVRVVAYEGKLVFIPNEPEKGIGDSWWPVDQKGKLGSVLGSSKRLGVSQEALALMRTIKLNRDAIGDIDWWKCDDGEKAFSWFGVLYRVMDPADSEAARGFQVYESECVIIPNEVPPEAVEAVKAGAPFWREPFTT
jgi:hypothetical protein